MSWILAVVIFGGQPGDRRVWMGWDAAPEWVQDVVVRVAYDVGISHPKAEQIDRSCFAGVVAVWQARFRGKPLPYPSDPIFGPR